MKFQGYWVFVESGRAVLEQAAFDETDLDPATDWKQAWQNQDSEASCKGYVELAAALTFAAQTLAATEGRSLSRTEADQAVRFEPEWTGNRCEIQSLSRLLDED